MTGWEEADSAPKLPSCREETGQTADALQDYQRVVQLEPGNKAASKKVAVLDGRSEGSTAKEEN